MVVLTDGEIFMDPLNLTTVISSTKMQGVERFAIGVRARSRGRLLSLFGEEPGFLGGASVSSLPNPVLCTLTNFFSPRLTSGTAHPLPQGLISPTWS